MLKSAGHSLGGGIAALLSMLLRSRFPRLQCLAYSPPGTNSTESGGGVCCQQYLPECYLLDYIAVCAIPFCFVMTCCGASCYGNCGATLQEGFCPMPWQTRASLTSHQWYAVYPCHFVRLIHSWHTHNGATLMSSLRGSARSTIQCTALTSSMSRNYRIIHGTAGCRTRSCSASQHGDTREPAARAGVCD
jgi:hypothetical protein